MIFKILLFIGVLVLFILFPILSCFVFHPISDIKNGIVDLFFYFKHKKYNNCKGIGKLIMFIGLFGKGKTLSAVHTVVGLYKKYNNKMVWDDERKCLVPQHVVVLSNVDLSIPFVHLESIGHFVNFVKERYNYDRENGCVTVTLCLIDEVSVQLNSRSFKTNIDPLFLNTLLTCRKYRCGLYMTAQRFNQVDALLRQVTQIAISCDKLWRFQQLSYYDAWEFENCNNPTLIKPKKKGCWFVHNSDYKAYDTLALVNNLKKSVEEGDMISEEEILHCMNPTATDITMINNPSRKLKKQLKKSS